MIEIDGEMFADADELVKRAEAIVATNAISNHEGHIVAAVPSYAEDKVTKCEACGQDVHSKPFVQRCIRFRDNAGYTPAVI